MECQKGVPTMRRRNLLIVTLGLAVLMQASPLSAWAHERRQVAETYEFVVGPLNEPMVTGQINGIDLRISDSQSNQAVEGAQDTLQAELIVSGQAKAVELQARFGMAGAYTAPLIA